MWPFKRNLWSDRRCIKRNEPVSSPSGQYTLTIKYYRTGKQSWDYTKGVVRTKAGKVVAVVKRNYSVFPFCWFTYLSKEYLICGSDYQGQTVVDCRSGRVVNYRPEAAKEGGGFCWSSMEQTGTERLLVNGCFWGGPYENVLYKVVDPMFLPYEELSRELEQDEDDEDEEEDEEDETVRQESVDPPH